MDLGNRSGCNCIGELLLCRFPVIVLGEGDPATEDRVELVGPDFGECMFTIGIF